MTGLASLFLGAFLALAVVANAEPIWAKMSGTGLPPSPSLYRFESTTGSLAAVQVLTYQDGITPLQSLSVDKFAVGDNNTMWAKMSGSGLPSSPSLFKFDLNTGSLIGPILLTYQDGVTPLQNLSIDSFAIGSGNKMWAKMAGIGLPSSPSLYEFDLNTGSLVGVQVLTYQDGTTPLQSLNLDAFAIGPDNKLWAKMSGDGIPTTPSLYEFDLDTNSLTGVSILTYQDGVTPLQSLGLGSFAIGAGNTLWASMNGVGLPPTPSLYGFDLNNGSLKGVQILTYQDGTTPLQSLSVDSIAIGRTGSVPDSTSSVGLVALALGSLVILRRKFGLR